MRVSFVISDRSSIKTFISILKLLYSNSSEVLFNFNKSGVSLSQYWQDKNTERGKYFFFLQYTHFSRILCNYNDDIFLQINIKEMLQKLKFYKSEVKLSLSFLLLSFIQDSRVIYHTNQ